LILLKALLLVLKLIGILLLVILGLIILISFLPVGVTAEYSEDGPDVTAKAGPVKLKLFPRPEKPEPPEPTPEEKQKAREKRRKKSEKAARKAEKKAKKAEKKQGETEAEQETKREKIGGMIPMFRELLGLVIEFQASFRNKLRIRELILHLTVGGFGSDPSKAAQLYGKAWAAIGNVLPLLMEVFRIEKRDVGAAVDFTQSDNRIYAKATASNTVGEVLCMGIWYGLRALKSFLKYKWNNRSSTKKHKKGGKAHGTSS